VNRALEEMEEKVVKWANDKVMDEVVGKVVD